MSNCGVNTIIEHDVHENLILNLNDTIGLYVAVYCFTSNSYIPEMWPVFTCLSSAQPRTRWQHRHCQSEQQRVGPWPTPRGRLQPAASEIWRWRGSSCKSTSFLMLLCCRHLVPAVTNRVENLICDDRELAVSVLSESPPSLPRCIGTPAPTSWEKPWRGCTEDASATAPPLRMDSTMTCSWTTSESPVHIHHRTD